jgi:hypothetical protein
MSVKLTASPINSSDKRILPPPYYFDDSRVAQYKVIYQDQDNASKMKEGVLGRIDGSRGSVMEALEVLEHEKWT